MPRREPQDAPTSPEWPRIEGGPSTAPRRSNQRGPKVARVSLQAAGGPSTEAQRPPLLSPRHCD
eukprot:1907378-Pyramimonas_sp.AAC.1